MCVKTERVVDEIEFCVPSRTMVEATNALR